MFRIPGLIVFIGFSLYSCSEVKERGKDYRPELLQKLDGQWVMNGQVTGDSVQYYMSAEPAINHMYTQIHLIDVKNPPGYEALIFIGYDSLAETIYAHWMDSFGGAYSVPHGEGSIKESVIEFQIPYKPSAFRDRFTYEPSSDSWTLVIDSRNDSLNAWDNFASYTIERSKR